jgi:hypothetical protein
MLFRRKGLVSHHDSSAATTTFSQALSAGKLWHPVRPTSRAANGWRRDRSAPAGDSRLRGERSSLSSPVTRRGGHITATNVGLGQGCRGPADANRTNPRVFDVATALLDFAEGRPEVAVHRPR